MEIFAAWFYYSMYYMLFAVAITLLINRMVKKLYMAPLLVNGIGAILFILLMITRRLHGVEGTYALYFYFMPMVTASIVTNLFIALWRYCKKK